jgi:hypothetical protein
VVDLRPTVPWMVQSLASPVMNGAVVLGCVVLAGTGLVRPAMVFLFSANIVSYSACAAWSLWCGRGRDAVVSATTVATPILMTWILLRHERYALSILFVPLFQQGLARALARHVAFQSATRMPSRADDDRGGSGGGGPAAVAASVLYFHLWLFAGGAHLWLRWRDVRRAHTLLGPDRARYDAAWALERARPGAAAALAGIAAAAAALAARAAACGPPRQLGHCRLGPRRATSDPVGPVDSLDQLFAAAANAHPLLLERTRAWAAASGGWFPAGAKRGAGLKSVERAVEKIVRVYRQVGGWGGGGAV